MKVEVEDVQEESSSDLSESDDDSPSSLKKNKTKDLSKAKPRYMRPAKVFATEKYTGPYENAVYRNPNLAEKAKTFKPGNIRRYQNKSLV